MFLQVMANTWYVSRYLKLGLEVNRTLATLRGAELGFFWRSRGIVDSCNVTIQNRT